MHRYHSTVMSYLTSLDQPLPLTVICERNNGARIIFYPGRKVEKIISDAVLLLMWPLPLASLARWDQKHQTKNIYSRRGSFSDTGNVFRRFVVSPSFPLVIFSAQRGVSRGEMIISIPASLGGTCEREVVRHFVFTQENIAERLPILVRESRAHHEGQRTSRVCLEIRPFGENTSSVASRGGPF